MTIRRTGHRYALRSEASLRFEKGQETRLARIGADRVAGLVAEWAGGLVAPGSRRHRPRRTSPKRGSSSGPPACRDSSGHRSSSAAQTGFLRRVGIEAEAAGADATVRVAGEPRPLEVTPGDDAVVAAVIPTWRRDLAIEADVAEEIARVAGYESIAATLPDTAMPAYRPDPLAARDAIRRLLAGAGLREVVTYALDRAGPSRGAALAGRRRVAAGRRG